MLYFFRVRVDHSKVDLDELWEHWEREAAAAEQALDNKKITQLFKVSGQRIILGLIDAESHDELDRIFMAKLPMAHMLEFEEILPVREYMSFAADVRNRWSE